MYEQAPHGRVVTALVYVPSCEAMSVARFSEPAVKASVVELVRSDFAVKERERKVIDTLRSENSKVFTVTAAQYLREMGRCP